VHHAHSHSGRSAIPVTTVLVALSAARFLARWSKSASSEQFGLIESTNQMSYMTPTCAI
jgi:hypothetical protein